MAARLSEWLDTDPLLLSPAWPYDTALIVGLDSRPNVPAQDQTVTHIEEFNRRYAFPRIVAGRVEDFFRDLERRYVTRIPVRRGDTGLYHEDGAGSQAAALALFRRTQLAARAADILALWNERLDVRTEHEADRRALWRDLLLFGEHTWGAEVSVAEPTSRATVAQWAYKLRFLDSASAAAQRSVSSALGRIGSSTEAGAGRVVFNASGWERTDVVRIPGGAGKIFSHGGRELPGVDSGDGSCFVVVRDVPALGYLALIERERAPLMAADEGTALEAEAGGFRARLDPRTGAIASLSGPDRRERVKPGSWSGLNHLVYVTGGAHSSMWTSTDGRDLRNAAALETASAELVSARRERLPGIGVRLVAERRVAGCSSAVSTVTLYDECPWVDIENRLIKIPTLEKEALYAAFPFALTRPTVEVEVPLGRMTVEQDQQPGSCRDWYCHAHWVWLHEAADGVLWSAPDTPLCTLNDIFRGEWRRRIEPDGTLFAYILNNYWPTNYAASQHGEVVARFRVSILAPGDPAEPVRRGWAACDPLYVSDPFSNASNGPLLPRDRALAIADRNVLVVNAKPADDDDGAVVRLLDIAGASRSVTVWPAAYGFRLARRTNLVERNEGAISVAPDGGAAIDVRAWGLACARLFTSREGAG
jgi:hypothetical protein